jgi:ABC-type branched-subunit amino acid transport system substrate-binding protein
MRKLLVAAVVLGLLIGAVGVAGAADSSTPGVTKDELKVGVTYVDLEAIRNVTDISHGDYEKTYRAVIDDLNKHGGVDGRKLVPVFAKINPIGTAPAQEACLKLTEDEHMFAVIGFFYFDAPLCYVAQHDTPIVGGQITAALLARAKAPWTTLESGAEVGAKVIDTLAQAGALKGKLGIVTLAADEQGLLNDVVLPALKRNKIKGTSAVLDASLTDTVAVTQQAVTFAERFKSDGIKTVLLVGGAPSAFITALAKTDYRPRLVGTTVSTMQGAALNPSTDPSVMKGAVSADIGVDFNDPSLQKCFRLVEKVTGDKILETPPAGEPDYRASAQTACRYVPLFAALATAAGKNPTVASFGKAAEKLGSVEIPGSGKITYDPKTHTFVQPMYTYKYDAPSKNLVIDKPVS